MTGARHTVPDRPRGPGAAQDADRRIVGAGTSEDDWARWAGWRLGTQLSAAQLLAAHPRLVVVAPHPDDESIAAGGLIHDASAAGLDVLVVAVTAGEGSHPGSTAWPRPTLVAARRAERSAALAELAGRETGRDTACVHELGLPDGDVAERARHLQDALRQLVVADDLVVAPWRYDGHPDHEAAGRETLRAAEAAGARCLQAPIWGWHWARPGSGQLPADAAVIVTLSDAGSAAKARAVGCFASQLEPDPTTGAEPILPPGALRRWLRDTEVFLA